MKKIITGMVLIISSSLINAQKIITYEEMKTITKDAFEAINCDIYVAKDGHQYKIGDTLKIGRPSTNKTFAYIYPNNTIINGGARGIIDVRVSGASTIIKKIYVVGTKKTGFQIHMIGKGKNFLYFNYVIDFEQAVSTGEIQSLGMTRDQAIAKLKEAKDLVDLGLMTKEDFEKIKEELSKIIIQKQ